MCGQASCMAYTFSVQFKFLILPVFTNPCAPAKLRGAMPVNPNCPSPDVQAHHGSNIRKHPTWRKNMSAWSSQNHAVIHTLGACQFLKKNSIFKLATGAIRVTSRAHDMHVTSHDCHHASMRTHRWRSCCGSSKSNEQETAHAKQFTREKDPERSTCQLQSTCLFMCVYACAIHTYICMDACKDMYSKNIAP